MRLSGFIFGSYFIHYHNTADVPDPAAHPHTAHMVCFGKIRWGVSVFNVAGGLRFQPLRVCVWLWSNVYKWTSVGVTLMNPHSAGGWTISHLGQVLCSNDEWIKRHSTQSRATLPFSCWFISETITRICFLSNSLSLTYFLVLASQWMLI